MIPVTKPFMPPREEYEARLKKIWENGWITNNGPLVKELEHKVAEYLGVDRMLYVSNGTIALQIAIKALGLEGGIITTPFSYVATTSSIVWEGCEPVFVDIDEKTLNIDPTKIEAAITPKTSAILATHVYGNPCDVEAIQEIADRHGLKVIYDAAHCFGTKYKGDSIFKWGDISTASFHATKLFHTVEGGGLFSKDPELLKKMAYMRNFGHDGPERFNGVGINGKNSEFHAAMGLCNLKYVDEILESRKRQCAIYDSLLAPASVEKPVRLPEAEGNNSYYPVLFYDEGMAIGVKTMLEKAEIYTRRYFYPGLCSLDYVGEWQTAITDNISPRILCLPLFHVLSQHEQELICQKILSM